MPLYHIKRGSTTIATIWPEGQQDKEIMLKDEVPISFKSPAALYFQIGDTIQVYGETYYLNALDEPTKDSTLSYRYQMNFVASYYALAKPKIFFYDSANQLKVIKFEAMITPRQLLDLIVANANRTQSGWVAGDCIDAPPKMLTFNGESLLTALDTGAKEFETEWWVKNKVVHLTKKGAVSGYKFEYGYDKGLRGGLSRTNVDTSSVFSRLYVTGSDQNLPVGYRNGQTNLQLPADTEYIQGPKYGDDEIEAVINFPDIKPERIGTISSVTNPFVFSDSGIDFDLNEPGRLLPGVSVKVSFLTGNLAGYNFEIAKGGYNHATRTVTIIKNEVEKALQLPSDLMKPAVGDTYFFFDLVMPASYVTDAENRVKVRGQEYFDENSPPRVAYDLPPDPFYFARNNIVLTIGDYVNVKDTELLLDKNIRVYSYSRDLHDGFKYGNLKVSDMPIGSPYIRAVAAAEKVTKALAISQVNNIQRARANWRTTNELTTLLDTVKAEMLLIMADGGAYTTNIVTTTTVDHFQTTTGDIYHEQYLENDGLWHVPAFQMDLLANVYYYVYIKASRFSTGAEIVLSETKIDVEADSAFYYFPFGIISTVILGNRLFTSIRGYTRVTGDTIDLGRIVSHDGRNYLDLNADTIYWGDENHGFDVGVTTPGQFTIRDAVVAKEIKVGSGGAINAFISGITDNGEESVRFGAGGARGDANLPFKVLDNGKMFAYAGEIANFKIDGNGLVNENGEAYIAVKKTTELGSIGATLGSGIPADFFGNSINAVAEFINTIPQSTGNNYGIFIDVANAGNPAPNFAVYIKRGNMVIGEGSGLLMFEGDVARPGMTATADIRVGGDKFQKFHWVKGVLTSIVDI